ncbi:bifunctional adenosylcobinamide kinase/adenosylcobinamide-phosphate guanylyltransferase [Bhargavaea ullalensis]|uniref:Adenosylcobinamide kinase n=1 Tax=Bhargavaea ullalensis TaxID=1265685 RepID=A0ABV2GBV7_9BACL
MVRGKITFISGGVRSGKTAYAETLLEKSECGRLVYVATGRPSDREMEERIRRHRQDRLDSPGNWETIERPLGLPGILPCFRKGDGVLIDCITTWLANEMYEGADSGRPCLNRLGCMEKKIDALMDALADLSSVAAEVVVVSNEVLDEPPSEWTETRQYAELLGGIHRRLVRLADRAIEMDAGIAHRWK